MKPLNIIAFALVLDPALNWGLVGTLKFDLVRALRGLGPDVDRLHAGRVVGRGARGAGGGDADMPDPRGRMMRNAPASACYCPAVRPGSGCARGRIGSTSKKEKVMFRTAGRKVVVAAALAASAVIGVGVVGNRRSTPAQTITRGLRRARRTSWTRPSRREVQHARRGALRPPAWWTRSRAGPFTVFAPTDEAFAKLPAGTVETLLKPENKEKLAPILPTMSCAA